MVVLSASLTVLAEAQQRAMHRPIGSDIADVPARVIEAVINGPGFAFPIRLPVLLAPDSPNWMLYYHAQRILGIGIFWFLIGLAIDRRNKPGLNRRHPLIAAVTFTLAALACGGLGGLATYDISREARIIWTVLTTDPLSSIRTIGVAWTLWILGFFGYFARQSFVAWNAFRETRN